MAIVNAMETPETAGENIPVVDQHHASLERLRATIDADLAHLTPTARAEDNVPTAGANIHTDAGHTAMVLVFDLVWITQAVWLADQLEAVADQLAQPA